LIDIFFFFFFFKVRIEKQNAAPPPFAAALSDKLIVDNTGMRDNIFDVDQESSVVKRNVSGNQIRRGLFFLLVLICQDNKRVVID
jgi:hypothetical protein